MNHYLGPVGEVGVQCRRARSPAWVWTPRPATMRAGGSRRVTRSMLRRPAPTDKRGFGFHPMLCFANATGQALAAVLRPENADA